MIKEAISQMIQEAIDGNTSCCEVHTELKAIETIVKSGLSLIKSGAVAEALNFEKDQRYYGGTWQIRSSATLLKYDDDEEYKKYSTLTSERKKLLNSAWKHKNEGHGFFITEEGEQIPVLEVKTPGTQSAIFKATKPKPGESEEGKKLIFD